MGDEVVPADDRSDQELRFYRTVFNSTLVMIHSSDMNGNIVSVNEYWLQRMGYSYNEVIGTPSTNYLTAEFKEKANALLPDLIKDGVLKNIEAKAVTKSGDVLDILVSAKIVHNSDGTPACFLTSLLDITERKNAERALRLREVYLTAIIENQPGLVWLKDADSRFLAVNRAFARSCGRHGPEELVGKTDFDIWPDELAKKYRSDDTEVMNSGVPVNVEELISDEGVQRWFETFKTPVKNPAGEIIGTTGYARDITARKLQEEALRNVQKLESLGLLAGGIAHDFNNLLSGVFGCIDLALTMTTERDVAEMLTSALGAMDRSRGLTQQLLTFASGGAPVKTTEYLVPFIQDSAKFALSGSGVTCEFLLSPDLWSCEVDKNQIGQVIDNIVINAQQAMPGGGTISISAANAIVDNQDGSRMLKNGHYVKISIADRGSGMSRSTLSRIFDPFFTTKDNGHGLGLATCYSIIKRHGGSIEVESEPGRGSVFHLFIPATLTSTEKKSGTDRVINKGMGTIIVMDDEEVVLYALEHMLQIMGYAVITTKNGKEAIDALRKEVTAKRNVGAMILDLTVPGGIGGQEAIAGIRAIDTNVPVYVVSGYAENPVMSTPRDYGFTASICKPFRIKELSEMLQAGTAS